MSASVLLDAMRGVFKRFGLDYEPNYLRESAIMASMALVRLPYLNAFNHSLKTVLQVVRCLFSSFSHCWVYRAHGLFFILGNISLCASFSVDSLFCGAGLSCSNYFLANSYVWYYARI